MAGNRVYSTETGRICPNCDAAVALCRCRKNKNSKQQHKPDSRKSAGALNQVIPDDGVVRLMRDTKGRKGAGATLIHGLKASDNDLKAIAKSLKQLCGCGGSLKQGIIEIQGDQREKIKTWLEAKGYKVKLAGG